MKESIHQRALELGFDDCRFTTAEPPESSEQFLKWLEDQCHGTMGWMERNAAKRIDPQLVLEPLQELLRALRRLGGGEAAVVKAQLECALADGFLHGTLGVAWRN